MELYLNREKYGEKATIGSLFIGTAFECYTLEDKVRELGAKGEGKIMKETAIPAGRYKVIIDFSQRFQKLMLHIMDVPFFTGIRIHSGNTDHDTEGCVLVGERVLNDDLIQGGSTALPRLFSKIKAKLDAGEEVWITVR